MFYPCARVHLPMFGLPAFHVRTEKNKQLCKHGNIVLTPAHFQLPNFNYPM